MDRDPDESRTRLSRRPFLATTGTAAAAVAVPGCVPTRDQDVRTLPDGTAARPMSGLDLPEAGVQTVGRFLDAEQVATVIAIADRVPGS